jgi:transcriptional regulator with XRE-family HTH domain
MIPAFFPLSSLISYVEVIKMSGLRIMIGERIRSVRKAKGLTQQNIADLSDLDDAYIGSVERGERNFSIDILEKILKALQIQPMDVLRFDKGMDEPESVRQQAIDEFMVITSKLTEEEIDILRKINMQLNRAFQ